MTFSSIVMSRARPGGPTPGLVMTNRETGVTREVVRVEKGLVFYQADSLPGKTLQVTLHDWNRWANGAR